MLVGFRIVSFDILSQTWTSLQSKKSLEFEMRALKGKLDKETQEHKSTTARLEARNRKYADIEGAKSEALKGTHTWINYSDLCKKCSSQSIDVVVKCCTKRNVLRLRNKRFSSTSRPVVLNLSNLGVPLLLEILAHGPLSVVMSVELVIVVCASEG